MFKFNLEVKCSIEKWLSMFIKDFVNSLQSILHIKHKQEPEVFCRYVSVQIKVESNRS